MSILERLLSQNGRTARINGHDASHDAEDGANEPKMDMLPLSAAVDGHCEKYLVLVSLTGAALDNQLMAVACSVAKTKPNVEVRAIYGIEVPRTLPVNAEMPEKTRLEMQRWGVRHVDIDILQWGSEEQSLKVLRPRAKHRCVKRMIVALQKKASARSANRALD